MHAHPSTRRHTCDTLVIGAGVMGLFVARALVRTGRRVRLLEAGAADAGLDGGASRAGGGILSPLTPWTESPAVQALTRDSQARYPAIAASLARRTGIDPEFRRTGGLFVGASIADMSDWCARHGLRAQHLDAQALAQQAPALAPQPALLVPELAQVRNPRLVDALRHEAVLDGVDVRFECPALGLISRGGRVTGAVTGHGRSLAGEVVVTAGAWSSRLLGATGFAASIRPVRGQMLWFRPFAASPRQIVLGPDVYVIPRADGVCLAGSTVEEVGFDTGTTASAARRIHAAAARLVPALAEEVPAGQWSGLRPGIDRPEPYTGAVPSLHGLYACAGHFRHGLTLAPASAAQLVAAMR